MLTVTEAAALRNVSVNTIFSWMRAGLPARRFGYQYQLRKQDVLRFVPRRVGRPRKKVRT